MAKSRRKAATGASFEKLSVGERVAWLLTVRRLTQSEAASLMGVSQSAISNLVADSSRHPSAKTLLAMARVLQCDPSFILEGTGDPLAQQTVDDVLQAELLRIYKNLPPTAQAHLLAFARILTESPQIQLAPSSPQKIAR